mgnify:CR=1 FL=1
MREGTGASPALRDARAAAAGGRQRGSSCGATSRPATSDRTTLWNPRHARSRLSAVARQSVNESFGEKPTPVIYLSYRDRPSARRARFTFARAPAPSRCSGRRWSASCGTSIRRCRSTTSARCPITSEKEPGAAPHSRADVRRARDPRCSSSPRSESTRSLRMPSRCGPRKSASACAGATELTRRLPDRHGSHARGLRWRGFAVVGGHRLQRPSPEGAGLSPGARAACLLLLARRRAGFAGCRRSAPGARSDRGAATGVTAARWIGLTSARRTVPWRWPMPAGPPRPRAISNGAAGLAADVASVLYFEFRQGRRHRPPAARAGLAPSSGTRLGDERAASSSR